MSLDQFKKFSAIAVCIVMAILPYTGHAQQSSDNPDHKNILMIVMDQERSWDTLPAGLNLPNRQKIAEQGFSFNQYHITTLSCAPSRSVIYTGQHVQQTTIFANPGDGEWDPVLDPDATPTIGQMFKKIGYKTAYKGKWHLSVGFDDDNSDALAPYGFDEWHKQGDTGGLVYEGAEKDKQILANAKDYISRQKNSDDPWFLAVNFVNPHDIMWLDANGKQAETRLRPGLVSEMRPPQDKYPYNYDFGFNVPANFKDDLSTKPEAQMEFVKLGQYFYGEQEVTDEEAYRNVMNYYAACLVDSDKIIGDLLTSLEDMGLSDDTIIVFTSDHGEMAGSHGLRHKGPFMYKENLNVPLVIRHPDGKVGSSSNALFSSVDLAPTLIKLVGEDYNKLSNGLIGHDYSTSVMTGTQGEEREELLINFVNTTQGNSRLEKIRMLQKEAEKRGAEPVAFNYPDDFIQFDTRTMGRGIVTKRYKFSRWFAPGDHHKPETWQALTGRNDLELYDLENDPLELNNMAFNPEAERELIIHLNDRLNNLIEREVGVDLGGHMPGNSNIWTSEN